jgi:diguanylate cyclase (GGDEF)-like protein
MHVVLVAADPSLMRSLTAILEKRVHDVVCFSEPQEALAHAAAHEGVNAMIVVESRHATPGPEICWEARLLESFERPLYICLICRPLNSQQFIEALDCGADDVLQLPLSSDELYARLRAAQRFIQMQRKLVHMATRDGLTGLLNRPAFFSRTARLSRDRAAPLAVVMADIDHFKAVNDSYGHAAGDKALRAVADCLGGSHDSTTTREANLAARMGGEEFALLLDGADADKACRAAESWRQRIATTDIDTGAGALRLSCSFGVALGAPEDDIDALLRKADAALYAAKRAGRNRVAFYDADIALLQTRPASLIRASRPSAFGRRRQSVC